MRILQISRTGADMLVRAIGLLFWLMYLGGLIAFSLEAVQWVAELAPLNAHQCAFNAGLALLGWTGSRLCNRWRDRLKANNGGAGLSAQSIG